MGLTLVGLTLISGAIAAVVAIGAAARRGDIIGSRERKVNPPGREEVAVSLLSQVLVAGGAAAASAEAAARFRLGTEARATVEIEISSWSRRYASISSREDCESLLSAAIDLASTDRRHIGAAQYGALVDLCFGLGLRIDAFSRMMASHRSSWSDYASEGRGSGGAREKSRAALLATLGLRTDASRRQLISAYRRLAAQYHPDHHHGLTDGEKLAAAARFIEITEAYETLLQQLKD